MFEQQFRFSEESFFEFGGYLTISTDIVKYYEFEKKLVEIQKAVHEYEFGNNNEKRIVNGVVFKEELSKK